MNEEAREERKETLQYVLEVVERELKEVNEECSKMWDVYMEFEEVVAAAQEDSDSAERVFEDLLRKRWRLDEKADDIKDEIKRLEANLRAKFLN